MFIHFDATAYDRDINLTEEAETLQKISQIRSELHFLSAEVLRLEKIAADGGLGVSIEKKVLSKQFHQKWDEMISLIETLEVDLQHHQSRQIEKP
ncbi:hypothetical protein ACQZV8_12450 [Magnetococcales bacterium HHB-1]